MSVWWGIFALLLAFMVWGLYENHRQAKEKREP